MHHILILKWNSIGKLKFQPNLFCTKSVFTSDAMRNEHLCVAKYTALLGAKQINSKFNLSFVLSYWTRKQSWISSAVDCEWTCQ